MNNEDKEIVNEDLEEDIPFQEDWKRVDVDELKQLFMYWLDDNIEHEYMKDPEFYLSNSVNEKRFYMRIIEKGVTDEVPEDKGYRCVFVPFDTKRVEETDLC